MATLDRLGRPLRSLRVSVTDRCNLRCQYCMPEPDYVWLPREDAPAPSRRSADWSTLSASSGVDRVRLTGGEPLLRRDLPVADRSRWPPPGDRGSRADDQRRAARRAGGRAAAPPGCTASRSASTRSIADRFHELTRFDALPAVLDGIEAAAARRLSVDQDRHRRHARRQRR